MASTLLPPRFADLEPYAEEWCLARQDERYDKRTQSPTSQLQAFYDACFPRLREALDYCDEFPIDDLPAEVVNLMHLLYSFVAVAPAVESWRQGRIPDTDASGLACLVEPGP